VLSDVDNPLLGTRGAAIAFSPQKGADARQVRALENGLTTLARHLPGDPTARGTGAAGGTGYGLATAWSAQIVSGSNAVASAVGLAAALHAADFVITGEGQLDESSFNGKVVGCVARTAQDASVPIYIIAGKIDDAALEHSKIHVVGSTDLVSVAGTVDRAMKDTCNVLSAAARSVANNLSRTNEDYACHTLKSTS
jgi:glycerate kinase